MAKVFKEISQQLAIYALIIQAQNRRQHVYSYFADIKVPSAGLVISVGYGGRNLDDDEFGGVPSDIKWVTLLPLMPNMDPLPSFVVGYDNTFEHQKCMYVWGFGRYDKVTNIHLIHEYFGVTLSMSYASIREFSENLKLFNLSSI